LDKYFTTVIEATRSPIQLTSHESAGYALPLDLIERLVERFPTITGVNYGGTGTTYLAGLIKRVGDRVEVHCAGSLNGLVTLGLGGNGFMGNEGNIAPALAASVISAFQAKDMERLRDSFAKLMGLAEIVKRFGGATLRGIKPLLNAFGLPGGTLREPRLPIDAAELDKMINAVLALQIQELPPLPKRA